MNFSNVLVLAPHTDDGELGCGGYINKLVRTGAKVRYLAFSAAENSVPSGFPQDVLRAEVLQATAELGVASDNVEVLAYKVRLFEYKRQDILEDLVALARSEQFDLVLAPSLDDVHQDHEVVAREAVRAFKRTTILGYELPWNNFRFPSTCFVSLSDNDVEAKCRAMSRYESQAGRSYSSPEVIRSFARARGVQIGTDYAECFEVIRWVMH